MKFWKKLGKALLFPHVAILVILVPIAICLLIYSLAFGEPTNVSSYIAYGLSAYTVIALCIRIPRMIRFVKKVRNESLLISMLLSDESLRINLSLFGSLVWNMAYAIFQMGLGFMHETIWYHSFAAYYAILGIMRFFLFKYSKKNTPGEQVKVELKRYRLCGILLAVMNLALGVIVGFIVYQNRTFVHHQITTITIATYTFTTLTIAIVNVVKYHNHKSPVFSAAKAINFAAALVSLLTLETTMLNTFGDETTAVSAQMLLGFTGSAVLVAILVMSIVMIVKATKKLKALDDEESQKSLQDS